MLNLPIFDASLASFGKYLDTSTMLIPRLANWITYSRPIPSVAPVTTFERRDEKKKIENLKIIIVFQLNSWLQNNR